ncbi:SMI1/KNR4 family protein [Streptomyces sp. C36]|uniref:SMI1/KNR4 family protein n=1 Tax=Streptomyces sp. C36 TaxID=3237122 RepID=UPI0034C6C54B
MTHIDLGDFDQAWDRFTSWLATNSPDDYAALRPSATAQEITGLEADLGFSLHPELRALLERHNGVAELQAGVAVGDQPGGFLPLGHRLSCTSRIASQHVELVEFGEENLASELWEEDDLNGHAHQWVPFALPIDGGVAFVDHRPGPTYGRVYEMGIGSGAVDATEWAPSLAGLFNVLADALETGAPFRHYWPEVRSTSSDLRCLEWDIRTRTPSSGT